MKDNLTSLVVVMDASGSMAKLAADTRGSFNTFIKEQKAVQGEATLSLWTFNSVAERVYNSVPLSDVQDLDDKSYKPVGNTALLDTLGAAIDAEGQRLAALDEKDRPSKVLVMVVTDGEENASQTFTKEKVREMVSHQQDKYNWSFLFLGANIDAFKGGTSLGFAANNSVGYTPTRGGTSRLYANVSDNVSKYRSKIGSAAMNWSGDNTPPADKK